MSWQIQCTKSQCSKIVLGTPRGLPGLSAGRENNAAPDVGSSGILESLSGGKQEMGQKDVWSLQQ